jgi:uncharacterized MAPEG superfamily protein
MSVELRLLAYSVVLLFVLILVQANAAVKAQGGKVLAGNRDNLAPPTAFEGRTRRTLYNHIEAMALFAPLVLIAAVSNISNDMTVLGARLFFYSRVAFALVYLIGIPYLRTLVWAVGVAGTVIVFLALFGIIG